MTIYDDEDQDQDQEQVEDLGEVAPWPHTAPETEALLNRLAEMIESARPMPLSTSSMINKDELLEVLDEAIDRLPDELRAARWLLKEREEFLDKVRREGDDITDQARAQAENMVQRTEVVKAAEQRARQIIDAAEAEARRLRHEVEDFCDQKLAGFEIVLDRTMHMVQAGREKLQGNPLAGMGREFEDDDEEEFEDDDEFGVFDQDDSVA